MGPYVYVLKFSEKRPESVYLRLFRNSQTLNGTSSFSRHGGIRWGHRRDYFVFQIEPDDDGIWEWIGLLVRLRGGVELKMSKNRG